MRAKHGQRKRRSGSGLFVAVFFAMFLGFMVWYFVICSSIAVAPSDFALVTIGVVTAVECVAAAFVKTRGDGSLTEGERKGIEFGVNVVAKALNLEVPYMQGIQYGTKSDSDTEGCG